jgi:solute carrier family 8 (sodium/calcium exchanger)
MALGSSAPEILLSVIEAFGTLGEPAGPLGASTIVGSAAFNLLVISAVSVIAVDEPKKILDVSVFFVTSCFSLFAYIWLYSCLAITSKE